MSRTSDTPLRWRQKPVVIEAVQWTGGNIDDVLVLVDFAALPSDGVHVRPGIGHTPSEGTLDIPTLEGTMRANSGDWIIRGVKGEVYPCKDEIFRMTYEPADEESREELRDVFEESPDEAQNVWDAIKELRALGYGNYADAVVDLAARNEARKELWNPCDCGARKPARCPVCDDDAVMPCVCREWVAEEIAERANEVLNSRPQFGQEDREGAHDHHRYIDGCLIPVEVIKHG